MAAYVALLRAVNVGGTGKLPMSDLKALCEKAGFGKVRTYIASGNVVFDSRETGITGQGGPGVRPGRLCREAGWRPRAHGGRDGVGPRGQPVPGRPAEPHRGHLSRWTPAR